MKQINSFSRVVYSLLAVLFLASAPLVLAQMSGPQVTNFPRTAIGSNSAAQTILLTTTAAETITSVTVPQSFGGKQEYSVGPITGCTLGAGNPTGAVCAIPVTFTPAYVGKRWVPLQIVTSTGNINFGLQGIGLGPIAALTPGMVSLTAGDGTAGFAGDGGQAASAQLNQPSDMAFDSAGNLYFVDAGNERVRKITPNGIITTVAGNGNVGFTGDGGPATSAEFNFDGESAHIAVDSAGDLYISDFNNGRVREVSAATGIITTVAGDNATAVVVCAAATDTVGDGCPGPSANLAGPAGIALDSVGNLYIADSNEARVRMVSAATGIMTTVVGNGTNGVSGDGGPATSAQAVNPWSLALDSDDNLYICFVGANIPNFNFIRKVTAATGIITTVAGNGTKGFSGDGGLATSAEIEPWGIAIDSANNLYIANLTPNDSRIRKVNAATGIITTVAAGATAVCISASDAAGDGCPATNTILVQPRGVALDNVGDFYSVDFGNNQIHKVDISSSAVTFPTPTMFGTSDSTDNPQAVTLSNIGNAPLTFSPPSSGSNASVSDNFSLDSSNTCPQIFSSSSPATLASGDDCTYAVDFSPAEVGAVSGSVVQTDDSQSVSGSSQTITLSGTGVAVPLTAAIVGNPTKVFDGTTSATLTSASYTLSGFVGTDGAMVTQTVGTYSSAAPGSEVVTAALNASQFTPTGNTNLSNYSLPTTAIGPGTITAAPSPIIKIVAGNNQTGYYSEFLPSPLVVQVLDGTNTPVPNVTVTFAGNNLAYYGANGAATLATATSGVQVITDANGMASVNYVQPTQVTYGSDGTPVATIQPIVYASVTNIGQTFPINSVFTLTVAPDKPQLQWTVAPKPIATGTVLSTMQLCAFANVQGAFAYSVDGYGPVAIGAILPPGTYTLRATFTPQDSVHYANGMSVTTPLIVNGTTQSPASVQLSWAAPAPITYGTALSTLQLNAAANVPGTFVYTPAPGTSLPVGSNVLTATFTPSDTSHYTPSSISTTLVVNPVASTITWPTPAPVAPATPLSAAQLNATASVPGTLVYSPAAGTVLPAGKQTLSVTFTPANAGYSNATAQVQIVVGTSQAPVITWSASAPITTAVPLSSMQLNASANVPGTFVYSPAAGTMLPVGTTTLNVTFTPTDQVNYTTATASVPITVKALQIPPLSWIDPDAISYGTPLSATQLNATSTVPGTFVYSPEAGTVLAVGLQALHVLFTPADAITYSPRAYLVALTVNKATPQLTWATPAAISSGTVLGATQLDASANVPGTFAYSPAAGTTLPSGTQTLTVTFTPTDPNYATATAAVVIAVKGLQVPPLTWISPAAISYGTALSATQLNAASTVPGTFTYSPVMGTVLDVGLQALQVTFTPTDTTTYSSRTSLVALTVNKAKPELTWAAPAQMTLGTALGATQLNATADIPGTFTYLPAAGTILRAGSNTLTVTFTPTDSVHYVAGTAATTVVVR